MTYKLFFVCIAVVIFSTNIFRIKKTFTIKSAESKSKKYKYFTVITACCYIIILLLGFTECIISFRNIEPIISSLGLGLYFLGYRLISASINALGNAWNIHVGAENVEKLVTTGIYSKHRHPYYFGSILQLLGWLLFLNAYLSIIVLLLLQLPLYLFRIVLEEQELIKKFGAKYIEYVSHASIF